MTEEANEETKSPFDFSDPSERVAEIVGSGHDPGDESDHADREEATAEEPKAEEPVTQPAKDPEPSEEVDSIRSKMKQVSEYLDEDLATVVNSLVDEIDRLKSERQNASDAAKVDDLVSSLGDEWQPVLRDKENRAKLNTAIQVIKTGYKRSNLPVPDEQEIVQKALRAEFGDVKDSIEQEATEAKVEARKSQMIARASGRRTDSMSPKESAMKAVHEIMAKRGLYNR